jgi:MFS family permease
MDAQRRVWWRLAGMMALIYAVQGAWWPLLAVHLQDLGLEGRQRGLIFATLAISALATPLGAGQLADRLMPTQRLLAIVYTIGSLFLGLFALNGTGHFPTLFALFLTYWLLTAPSYGLANSLAFRNLSRPREQFGSVRLFGTIGWMAVGWTVTGAVALSGHGKVGQGAHEAFAVAAVVSLIFAGYCLTLPNTPPLATGVRRAIDVEAVRMLVGQPAVAVFLAVAFGVSLTMPFVYQTVPSYLQTLGLPRHWIASAMTLSQVPEILALAALPRLLKRFGYRGTLPIGIAAWVIYYAALAAHPPLGLALLVLPLNGVAIACFVVAGQMYLDSQAPADRRASAQALHVMVTSGIGSLLGNLLAGELQARQGGVTASLFLAPGGIALAMLAAAIVGFRPGQAAAWTVAPVATPAPRPSLATSQLAPERGGS